MIEQFLAEFGRELGNLVDPAWWQVYFVSVLNVIMIDVVLAGDNAIVVGLAASRVSPQLRAKVIFWGIAAAVIMRIGFSAITQQLLAVVGLTLLGGFLLLWVCWKMYRQITGDDHHDANASAGSALKARPNGEVGFWAAVTQIAIADISMSLDNVIAVAGVAGKSFLVLIIGLVVAIVLMAVASHFIASLLVKFPWITWIGLIIILYVAIDMIFRGSLEVSGQCGAAFGTHCPGMWEWTTRGFG